MRTLRIFSSLFFTLTLSAFACGGAVAAVQIRIDKSAQRMVVSVDGVERYTWPVSTGRLGHDTPSGSFRTFRMEKDHFSKEWDDAPMPHSIFFTKIGHAIHGTFSEGSLGVPVIMLSGDDCLETSETQVGYLRAAGFDPVDVTWSRDLWAVFVGRK